MNRALEVTTATRITSGVRRASSRPVVAETDAGVRFVKLRGAAQGTGSLIAEIIVGALAEAIGLHVPERSLVRVEPGIEAAGGDDELDDLLRASGGLNLGFALLDGARDFVIADTTAADPDTRTAILWLDRLVLNPDRTARNPNLMWSASRLWLIDHGAALGFQYDWSAVTEDTPRRAGAMPDPHLFDHAVSIDDLLEWDAPLAERLTRATLTAAVAQVPDEFLVPLMAAGDGSATVNALERRRAAYVAFLWKRLRAPRPFLQPYVASATPRSRGRRPDWLRRA